MGAHVNINTGKNLIFFLTGEEGMLKSCFLLDFEPSEPKCREKDMLRIRFKDFIDQWHRLETCGRGLHPVMNRQWLK